MKIGVLVTSISNFGQKGFYNAQEVGLAKALDKFFDEVVVYKLVPLDEEKRKEKIENTKNATIYFLPSKNFGINGFPNTNYFDQSLDALIHFSDTQLSVPEVYRWTKRNGVKYLPYVGVTESHSNQKLIRLLTDGLFRRNLRIYRKCQMMAKTPAVEDELKKLGIKNVSVMPVGLDESLLRKDYETYETVNLKEKYGYSAEERVVLFIGRLIEEKRPNEMIEIFSDILKEAPEYRLLMVGKGELKQEIEEKIKNFGLEKHIRLVEQIPNRDIWELYRMADAFVNLNRQEIFGMAILEAMYYGCKVVAWNAPGPDFIIENGSCGYLASNKDALIQHVLKSENFGSAAHQRIMDHFTWESMAEGIYRRMNTRRV